MEGTNQVGQKKPKLLILGIDGTRPDSLVLKSPPTLSSLWKEGAYSFDCQTAEITISGPTWGSALSGVWISKHKILDNNTIHYRKEEAPHVFDIIKKYNKNFKCASISTWKQIDKFCVPSSDFFWCSTFEKDEETIPIVQEKLLNEDYDAYFVHLDEVDHAGHDHGFSPLVPQYLNAIESVDKNCEKILSSLKQRKTYEDEDWLILVVTDHGGTALTEKNC